MKKEKRFKPKTIVKYGKTIKGVQRYKNKETNKYHNEGAHRVNDTFKMLCVFLYFNGLSMRRIGRMFKVSHVSVFNWVGKYSNEATMTFNLSELKQVCDIEIDKLYTFFEKKNSKCYVMLAIDRATYQITHLTVTESRDQAVFNGFLDCVTLDPCLKIDNFHTDAANQYLAYFGNHPELSITYDKANTTQVESFNSVLRGYLPFLVRRTKVITHSVQNLYNRLYTFCVLYNKKITNIFDFLDFSRIFVPAFS